MKLKNKFFTTIYERGSSFCIILLITVVILEFTAVIFKPDPEKDLSSDFSSQAKQIAKSSVSREQKLALAKITFQKAALTKEKITITAKINHLSPKAGTFIVSDEGLDILVSRHRDSLLPYPFGKVGDTVQFCGTAYYEHTDLEEDEWIKSNQPVPTTYYAKEKYTLFVQ